MCDYSLMSFPNRLATEGEELLVHRFSSGAKGLAALSDLQRAATSCSDRRKSLQSLLDRIVSFIKEIVSVHPSRCAPSSARHSGAPASPGWCGHRRGGHVYANQFRSLQLPGRRALPQRGRNHLATTSGRAACSCSKSLVSGYRHPGDGVAGVRRLSLY